MDREQRHLVGDAANHVHVPVAALHDHRFSSCVNIPGATANTYVTVTADIDDRLRARVTATNSAGSATATSNASDASGKPPGLLLRASRRSERLTPHARVGENSCFSTKPLRTSPGARGCQRCASNAHGGSQRHPERARPQRARLLRRVSAQPGSDARRTVDLSARLA